MGKKRNSRTMNMTHASKKPQISILFFLMSFANVLGVLYTPALPELTKYFDITKAQAQETVSFFLIGCLLSQIVYAPIANALGRKSAIYIGGGIAILGSLVCLFSIEMRFFSLFLWGRGLTAFGAACGLVLTNTIIADSFTLAQTKKILSYLICGFALFPAISIAIGGFITEYFSWEGCFYFMLIYSFFVIGLCILLPETAQGKDLSHFNIKKIAKSYYKQSSNLLFFLYALLVACGSIFLYVFSAEAPFIAIHQLHISPDSFGLYNLIPNIGLLLGGFASAFLSHRLSTKTLILMGSSTFFALSVLMGIFFEAGIVNIFTLFVLPLFIFFSAPIILSNGQAQALDASEEKPYASSLMYVTQYSWMFLSVFSLGFFSPQYSQALPIVYSVSGILMIVLWIVIQTFQKKKLG